jgi:uncharacterized membrane protein
MILKTKKKKDHNMPKRVLAKAVSWETFSTLLTGAIAYPFTNSIGTSIELAVACLAVKIVFYYQHERLWNQVTWGKSYE